MTPKRFVDILNSHSDSTRYYTGIAGNVRRRLEEHNAGGCRHTHRWRPWRVVVVIAFASEQRALDFERYLKTGPGHTIAHNAVAFFHDGITISTHGIPVPTASTGRWRSTSAGVKIPNVSGGSRAELRTLERMSEGSRCRCTDRADRQAQGRFIGKALESTRSTAVGCTA